MLDNANPEFTSIPENNFPRVLGLTTDEILRDPNSAIATFAKFVESAQAATAQAAASQRQLTTNIAEGQAQLDEIKSVATQAAAAKTQIADAQAVIATKSDHIQSAQEHADKVRADLDRALTAATQQVTATEGQKDSAETIAENVAELLTQVQKAKNIAETEATATAKARKDADDSTAITKSLADKAETVEDRITGYEKRLAELEEQCANQLKTIIGLLPGATSAGLAHAFDNRRQTFLKPQGRWQVVFVSSVGAIVLLAITGLWHVYHAGVTPTYDELVRLWLSRLPVAGALVWLALHSSHEAALAKRLEEDYGYKSAIASCFEGFQKQMSEIGEGAVVGSPLATLCGNTLKTIASPPGRIYDDHKLTVSPTDELKEVAKAAVDVAGAVKHPAK